MLSLRHTSAAGGMSRHVHNQLRRLRVVIGLCYLLGTPTSGAFAQVDFSGDNSPVDNAIVDENLSTVAFFYSIFDSGRTEPEGRGTGLGAALFHRDAADTNGVFAQVAMDYIGQTGPFGPNNDLFMVQIPRATFGSATQVEYYTVAFDSTVNPVHQDKTQQDANGNPPNFTFSFGNEVMPHNTFVHFSLCLDGVTPFQAPVVRIDPGGGNPPFEASLSQVAQDQVPDIYEREFFFSAGTARTLRYTYWKDGQQERDATNALVERQFTLALGPFLQSPGTDSWRQLPLGCHLNETTTQSVKVHFSLCMTGTPFSGNVCITGNTPELGDWQQGLVLQNLQGAGNSDLFEGDVVFPAGSPAVIQYKFQRNDCADWESLPFGDVVNRFFYLGGPASVIVAPSRVWADSGANLCGLPTSVSRRSWSNVKSLYR